MASIRVSKKVVGKRGSHGSLEDIEKENRKTS